MSALYGSICKLSSFQQCYMRFILISKIKSFKNFCYDIVSKYVIVYFRVTHFFNAHKIHIKRHNYIHIPASWVIYTKTETIIVPPINRIWRFYFCTVGISTMLKSYTIYVQRHEFHSSYALQNMVQCRKKLTKYSW